MNLKHLLIPAALASTFALGVYTSQSTKHLLTQTYQTIDKTLEQYTPLNLPDLSSSTISPHATPLPTASPYAAPPPPATPYKAAPTEPNTAQLQHIIQQLQLENNSLKQQLIASPSPEPSPNYYPRARELSAHDLAQPFLMNFANNTNRFLNKYLDPEQQALHLYNQIASNIDLLTPDQRRDLAVRLEHNDTRWLTPEQKTQRLYNKTTQALPLLPQQQLQSLDQTLHATLPFELTQCPALCPSLFPLPYLRDIITTLLPSNTTYRIQNSDILPLTLPPSPLPLPTSISPTTIQPPPDYDKIISQQIEQQLETLDKKIGKIGKQVKQQIGTTVQQTGSCKIDKIHVNVNAQLCPEPSSLPPSQPSSLPDQPSQVDLNKEITPTK